ncbi:MAG: glycoside hydrolase family 3 protein [Clostridia bacterium]|nr:glycoside hydrolase family 3 protein [Clostridia bacterium]
MDSRVSYEYLTGKRVYDPAEAQKAALKAAEEGIVLLKNDNNALPLAEGEKTAFFGRMQKHYVILGTGSGGRVSPPFTTNIFDSLASLGVGLDKETESFYDSFVAENPYDEGNGWTHPASQKEPELAEALVASAARRCGTALFVITRTAGEDRDLKSERGEYLLSETELANLKLLRAHFKKLVVLLNVSGIIDCAEILSVSPDALVLLWTGGMAGGLAAARVLTGRVSPCGKLPDTVAASRADYPAYGNCGAAGRNIYAEDIYVGYRYFSTFASDKVLFPFGFGLSYTSFSAECINAYRDNGYTELEIKVANTGKRPGREVIQCYVEAPQGALGKPARVLAAFAKTPLLAPGGECVLRLGFDGTDIASFDDTDPCGNGRNWVLEAGEYTVYCGTDVQNAKPVFSFVLNEDGICEYGESALAPVTPFNKLVNRNGKKEYVPVNLRLEAEEYIPEELPRPARDDIKFEEVAEGKAALEDFVAQLSDEELITLVRAEGMSSPKVTPGTAAAFVGTTARLRARGLPVLCCTDGPSGLRMVSDAKCTAYPSATCLAATWDTELVESAYEFCGAELATYRVDILLGPGTNIHRDPLCGRNFEYFSEDPLLAGKMAAAVCRGLDNSGVSGAVKHFMANNQETDRHGADSVISERALREIYSRPFAICVAESNVRSVMTSYNPVNGRWAASNYDLTVRLLRNAFGFDGFVMTDWWARVSNDDGTPGTTNLAAMVHAGNDIYMVCSDALTREDNLASALAEGSLARSELQRAAYNLCSFALQSLSFRAMQNGYGVRDLRAECAGKEPLAMCETAENRTVYKSPCARRATVKINYVSHTPELTQTDVEIIVNDKNAGSLLVGGTGGRTESDFREISLAEGENRFAFKPESSEAQVLSLEIY